MKIALHAATLRGLGSSQVGQAVISELLTHGGGHQYHSWVPETWPADAFPRDADGVRRVAPGVRAKVVLEQIELRSELRGGDFDALFSLTDTSLIRCPVPHLLLVHQPHLAVRDVGFRLPPRARARYTLMSTMFKLCLPTVSTLTVQSQFMKAAMADRWGFPPERIAIVPSAIASMPETEGAWSPDASQEPFVIYPASPVPHKNHIVLAEMLADLQRRDLACTCLLTAAPEDLPGLVRAGAELGVSSRLRFIGRQSAREVRLLMAGASALVMPSMLESFGIPYVEAMSVGTPVVCADLPFAREACGEAALYCAPRSGRHYADALAQVLTDPHTADSLSRRGLERFEQTRWSWPDAASAYVQLLERLQ